MLLTSSARLIEHPGCAAAAPDRAGDALNGNAERRPPYYLIGRGLFHVIDALPHTGVSGVV